MDKLRARAAFQQDVRECNILCFTETWLTPLVPDQVVTWLNYFTGFRMDRTTKANKTKGGGLCFMVNTKWCEAKSISLTRLEQIAIKCRPFYLPQEFNRWTRAAMSELHKVLSVTQLKHCGEGL